MSEQICPICKSQNVSEPISLNGYWWCEDCKNPFISGIDGWVSIRPLDLERNYISRISFDALLTENARLKRVIQGMSPLWFAAMSYAEHGRAADLDRIRNYYNGRDNPMTSEETHLMFSLIPDGGKNGR